MNNARRKQIREISDQISELLEELMGLRGEEEEARDNMPESFHDTERYEQTEAACDLLEETTDALEAALETLEEVMEPA